MKPLLTLLLLLFLSAAKAQTFDSILIVHPRVGSVIDKDEKLKFHLLSFVPSGDFDSARFFKSGDTLIFLKISRKTRLDSLVYTGKQFNDVKMIIDAQLPKKRRMNHFISDLHPRFSFQVGLFSFKRSAGLKEMEKAFEKQGIQKSYRTGGWWEGSTRYGGKATAGTVGVTGMYGVEINVDDKAKVGLSRFIFSYEISGGIGEVWGENKGSTISESVGGAINQLSLSKVVFPYRGRKMGFEFSGGAGLLLNHAKINQNFVAWDTLGGALRLEYYSVTRRAFDIGASIFLRSDLYLGKRISVFFDIIGFADTGFKVRRALFMMNDSEYAIPAHRLHLNYISVNGGIKFHFYKKKKKR